MDEISNIKKILVNLGIKDLVQLEDVIKKIIKQRDVYNCIKDVNIESISLINFGKHELIDVFYSTLELNKWSDPQSGTISFSEILKITSDLSQVNVLDEYKRMGINMMVDEITGNSLYVCKSLRFVSSLISNDELDKMFNNIKACRNKLTDSINAIDKLNNNLKEIKE